jgi:hypothetical protein
MALSGPGSAERTVGIRTEFSYSHERMLKAATFSVPHGPIPGRAFEEALRKSVTPNV